MGTPDGQAHTLTGQGPGHLGNKRLLPKVEVSAWPTSDSVPLRWTFQTGPLKADHWGTWVAQ